MTIKAMGWAWGQALPSARKLVLVALADSANDDGVCWPGLRTISGKCGMTVRSVQRHIDALIEGGYMAKSARHRDTGSRTSNLYELRLDRPADLARAPDTVVAGPLTTMSPPPRHQRHGPRDTGVVAPPTSVSRLEPSLEPSDEPKGEKAPPRGGQAVAIALRDMTPPDGNWRKLLFGPALI